MPFQLLPRGVPLRKRLLDLVIAIPCFILASPFMLAAAAAILISEGPPVFFLQSRPGRNERIFTNIKFRSMRNAYDRQGCPLPDAQRISRLGHFLRATSIDELPELINVLKGEISLVGPRPLLVQYLERYTPEQARRHTVLPGITGWAQINGRNALTWEDKFKLDTWYVDHWSLRLDVKILALTVWKVLKREGISGPGQATNEEFKGSK
jgi:lipopolysaccharide/colanic/teichoic acid biosynthesis glycosyltransferase